MTTPVNDLVKQFAALTYNPIAIQRLAIETLKNVSDGTLEVVDPSNPFVYGLEIGAVMTAAGMSHNETLNRFQYIYAASTPEELYPHLSDMDYVGRFATPSKTRMNLSIDYTELLSRLVYDPDTGNSKLVIPRNTFFTVADTVFSIQYPIEIRQLAHGGLQIVYNAEQTSPLQTLNSNIVDFELRNYSGNVWLWMEFDVTQFFIDRRYGHLDMSIDYKEVITLKDKFYYARVFYEDTFKNWVEIRTTHTDQIYDPTVATAVLKVVGDTLEVRIPQVYTNRGILSGARIRMDVYETKGELEMSLSSYPADVFVATWYSTNDREMDDYTTAWKNMRGLMIYSNGVVTGGGSQMSFQELRSRAIRNTLGAIEIPITPVQLEDTLLRDGYNIVKNIDNITDRVYLATRGMVEPNDGVSYTPATASIESIIFQPSDAKIVDSIIDNGSSYTITPETLFVVDNNIVRLIPSTTVAALNKMGPEEKAAALTNNSYLYTPFHYMLDMSGTTFEVRPYYLDNPLVMDKLFVAENDTTLIQVSAGSYNIEKKPKGYVLTIRTESKEAYKALADEEVFVQLSFKPFGEVNKAFINGTYVGNDVNGERIYEFDLSTNWNVNSNNCLELTKFKMYDAEDRICSAPLRTEFDLVFVTSAPLGGQWEPNEVDMAYDDFILPTKVAGLTHEKLRVQFGHSLDTLWARSRSAVAGAEYQKWDTDVPLLYEADVYAVDPTTGSTITFDMNNNPVVTILHKRGDIKYDTDGNVIYQYRKGDIKYDADGNPIPVDARKLIRQFDIMLIEGVYRFATDTYSKAYRAKFTEALVSWLTEYIPSMDKKLLEKTQLFFYPKNTLGSIEAIVDNGAVRNIQAAQSFILTLYVNKTVYQDMALRKILEENSVNVIHEKLKADNVAVSGIVAALRKIYGSDVVEVSLTGLGGDEKISTLTVVNETDRCSIRKRLAARADGSLAVEEDITFNFIRHTTA